MLTRRKWFYSSASTVAILLGAIYSITTFSLFKGTVLNRSSVLAYSIIRCSIDSTKLDPEIVKLQLLGNGVNQEINLEYLSELPYKSSNKSALIIRKHGAFLGHDYGVYSRTFDEPVGYRMFITNGDIYCLMSDQYIGIMTYYHENKQNIFQIIYYDNSKKTDLIKL